MVAVALIVIWIISRRIERNLLRGQFLAARTRDPNLLTALDLARADAFARFVQSELEAPKKPWRWPWSKRST